LYQQCSKPLKFILTRLSIYPNPISEDHLKDYEPQITGISQWKERLQEGMNLGLVEHDQIRHAYNLTPLLKEKLKKE
jgi:hypothetical protein